MLLLDTDTCVALLRRRPTRVRERLRQAMTAGRVVAVSSLVVFELWYGAFKSKRPRANGEQVTVFLLPFQVLPFDAEDAEAAGAARAELVRQCTPIGAYDHLIAGQALRHRAVLVTANVSEFERIQGLQIEDWTQ